MVLLWLVRGISVLGLCLGRDGWGGELGRIKVLKVHIVVALWLIHRSGLVGYRI